MSVFSAAIDLLFEDPNMAAEATYITVHGEIVTAARVMRRPADPDIAFGDSRISARTAVFDIRVSEVADPRAGDRLMIGTEIYLVQGTPTPDAQRLVWTLDTRPTA